EEERQDKFPFIWTVDKNQNLVRVLVAQPIVASCEERKHFWVMLRNLAGLQKQTTNTEDVEDRIRKEVVGKIAKGLMELAGGGNAEILDGNLLSSSSQAIGKEESSGTAKEYMAPWIETESCTSCDECIKLNNKIFAYNHNKKAFIQNAKGGSYQDLVKAAEKCTARVIHPGLPANTEEKDIDKWIKRGEKFN
ncbi:MAG TPA: ferredoxin, partial [Saprospiraceae bacterium]|nr:ferredoxin [Saprospiraceae bacterium]